MASRRQTGTAAQGRDESADLARRLPIMIRLWLLQVCNKPKRAASGAVSVVLLMSLTCRRILRERISMRMVAAAGVSSAVSAATYLRKPLAQLMHSMLQCGDDAHKISQIAFRELPQAERFNAKQMLNGEHIKKTFSDIRQVVELDPAFCPMVCRRVKDVCTKHPVLVLGPWRQGKSSLVKAILEKRTPDVPHRPQVGRNNRTTTKVQIYPVPAGELGEIYLADTPSWEHDQEHRVSEQYLVELERLGCSTEVLTDLIVLVIAGQPQSLSELQDSEYSFNMVEKAYAEARSGAHLQSILLPVITFGDQMLEENRRSDVENVRSRLMKLHSAHKPGVHTEVLDPVIVSTTQPDGGADSLFEQMRETVRKRFDSDEFRLQWTAMQNADLTARVREFHRNHPDEVVERRLFHRVIKAIMTSYGKELVSDYMTLFPEQRPKWELLKLLEDRLRGETNTIMSRFTGAARQAATSLIHGD